MDSNKIALVLGGLLLAAFIALPLMNKNNAASTAATQQGTTQAAPEAAPLPPVTGPSLTANDLANTTWDVPSERGIVRATLHAGGTITATPPPALANTVLMMTGSTTLQGTWTMNGTNVTVTAKVGPTVQTFKCEARGQDLYCGGERATRVQ